MDCIAAISTPNASGGVSMIRISGEDAFAVAKSVFSPKFPVTDIDSMAGYTGAYGNIIYKDKIIDDGMLFVYRAPHSYTGENVCEITCHGGIFVTRQVLKACLDAGAKSAGAGEFTKRALLNGKLSLTQAEAVMDIINAESEQALSCAKGQADGALYKRIEALCDSILSISSEITAWIDYPDEAEDEDRINFATWQERILSEKEKMSELIETFADGRIMREGIATAIAGKPNVGKSTLMNLLTGTEKSIVTDIEGTTRDIVEETVMLSDIMLNLSDCAGMRETTDRVESIGVEKMLRRIDTAQLVLAVFDGSRELDDEDRRFIEKVKGKTVVPVINKTDLEMICDKKYIEDNLGKAVLISAKNGDKTELETAVRECCNIKKLSASEGFLANERQRQCALSALVHIESAYNALYDGMTADIAGTELEAALSSLYELSGKYASEEIIDSIFSRFCVGK